MVISRRAGRARTSSRGLTMCMGVVVLLLMESGEDVLKSGGGGVIGKMVRVKVKLVKVDAGREKKVKDKETFEAD